jgi:hypothetical protein
MLRGYRLTVLSLCSMALLAGCGILTPTGPAEMDDPRARLPRGSIMGDNSPLMSIGRGRSGEDQGGALGVNAYLWRGALETLSFMPLVSADPFGGVIITDWYQPPGGGAERFKATAYILGRTLRADGIRISVFRQVLQGATWMDAPVSPTAASELENKVLARARALRVQQAGSN